MSGYEADPDEVARFVEEVVRNIVASWPGAPLPQYGALSAEAAFHKAVSERLTDTRAAVVARLNSDGMSYARIAEMTGLTRARVQQLAERGRALAAAGEYGLLARPERKGQA